MSSCKFGMTVTKPNNTRTFHGSEIGNLSSNFSSGECPIGQQTCPHETSVRRRVKSLSSPRPWFHRAGTSQRAHLSHKCHNCASSHSIWNVGALGCLVTTCQKIWLKVSFVTIYLFQLQVNNIRYHILDLALVKTGEQPSRTPIRRWLGAILLNKVNPHMDWSTTSPSSPCPRVSSALVLSRSTMASASIILGVSSFPRVPSCCLWQLLLDGITSS